MKKLLLIILFIVSLTFLSYAQGQWEIGAHYSSWSTGFVVSDPEDYASDAFDEYDGPIKFDPHGHNFGFGIRFFPAGKQGSFSIGFSYERNYFKADLSGSYKETVVGGTVTKTGSGKADLTPHSFNLDFRWDIFPSSRVHPYLGIGFGVGPLNGDITYTTITETDINGSVTTKTVTEKLTLKEAIEKIDAEQDEDLYLISFFPIVHLNLGVRGEIVDSVYLLGEVAFYDGFIIRGGLAYRF
jgi:hypothetical protein